MSFWHACRPFPTSLRMLDLSPRIAYDFRNSLRACTLCDIHANCTPVPWYGPQDAEVCVVGEAPGASEAKEGRPFIGSAGTRLRYLLSKGGLDYNQVAFLNAVSCWPKRGLDVNADRGYIDICRKWMRGQVSFIRPRYVITVGVVAFYSVTGLTFPKLRELHGKPLYWDDPPAPLKDIYLWPTYHPAAALRSSKYQKLIEEDLVGFKTWRENGELILECCYVCGDELYRYDRFGIGLCERHAQRQGNLFPERVV